VRIKGTLSFSSEIISFREVKWKRVQIVALKKPKSGRETLPVSTTIVQFGKSFATFIPDRKFDFVATEVSIAGKLW
jgi:hypothetical protein